MNCFAAERGRNSQVSISDAQNIVISGEMSSKRINVVFLL